MGYLEYLRDYNSSKPKKDQRSSSVMEIPTSTKIKRIDYLRENKPNLTLKKTIGEWKKIVGDVSYSPREKYESIMEQAAVLGEKSRMKEEQLRSYKKGEKALDLQNERDQLYAESVAAKLVVLKDVILK